MGNIISLKNKEKNGLSGKSSISGQSGKSGQSYKKLLTLTL